MTFLDKSPVILSLVDCDANEMLLGNWLGS